MPRYRIEDVEGIGSVYAKKLRKVGVKSVDGLLKKTKTRKGRKELAAETSLGESQILKWANMADLYRIKGIGSEYAELLEKAGVDTVKELRKRRPDKLWEKIVETNTKGKRARVRQLPGIKKVESWVRAAKKLSPMIKY